MKKRILVAEDDSGVSDALQMILEDAGYEVETMVHVILLSAQRGIQAIAKEVGADNYLAKPFEIEALLALVAQYMGQSQ